MIEGHAPVRARRTHSLPSKYMIPSEDMGEYESPMRRKSAPERERPPPGGGLFPLSEQGEYGQPPKAPLPPPPPYKRRELKGLDFRINSFISGSVSCTVLG